MTELMTCATIAIGAFAAIAAFDGLYLHLYRFRLHTRPESFVEHVTHSLHALLFPAIVYLLFGANHGGALLWLAAGLVTVDFFVETWDVLIENGSRRSLGGLPSYEYWLHTVAITTRVAAVTLVFAAKPLAAWSLSSPLVLSAPYPAIATTGAMLIWPGAIGIGLLHVALMHPRFRRAAHAAAEPA